MLKPEEPGDPEDDLLPSTVLLAVDQVILLQLGPHRLICGNALDRAPWRR